MNPPFLLTNPEACARNDYMEEGANCNPYDKLKQEAFWLKYEYEMERLKKNSLELLRGEHG